MWLWAQSDSAFFCWTPHHSFQFIWLHFFMHEGLLKDIMESSRKSGITLKQGNGEKLQGWEAKFPGWIPVEIQYAENKARFAGQRQGVKTCPPMQKCWGLRDCLALAQFKSHSCPAQAPSSCRPPSRSRPAHALLMPRSHPAHVPPRARSTHILSRHAMVVGDQTLGDSCYIYARNVSSEPCSTVHCKRLSGCEPCVWADKR